MSYAVGAGWGSLRLTSSLLLLLLRSTCHPMCRWDVLPVSSKVTVLLALQHTICWLREVVAVFGPSISIEALVATAGSENTQAT